MHGDMSLLTLHVVRVFARKLSSVVTEVKYVVAWQTTYIQ